jgi:hypothetical protein
MHLSKIKILGALLFVLLLTSCKREGVYTFKVKKGEGRFEKVIATENYHGKWLFINSAPFSSGNFDQEARFVILLDDTVVSDFEVIEKSVADSDFRYYFPLIQQPVLGANEVKIVIEPLDGEFHSTFSFRIMFLDENIQ